MARTRYALSRLALLCGLLLLRPSTPYVSGLLRRAGPAHRGRAGRGVEALRMGISTLRTRDGDKIWGGGRQAMYRHERLTKEEELELGTIVQEGMRLAALRDAEEETMKTPMSFERWAELADLTPADLAKRLNAAAAARNRFILANLTLIASIAKRFTQRGLTYEELIQEGVFGMNRAVDLYDPSRLLRFSTYASRWVEQRIRMSIKRDGLHIRIPGRLVDLHMKVVATTQRLEVELGRSPTDEELCDAANVTPRDLEVVRNLPEQVGALDDVVRYGEVLDMISSHENQPGEYAEAKTMRQDIETTMRRCLTPSERDILRLRVGLDDGKARTFGEVADLLNLKKSAVVRIERLALKKMRSDDALAALDGYMGVDKETTERLIVADALDSTLSSLLPVRGRKKAVK